MTETVRPTLDDLPVIAIPDHTHEQAALVYRALSNLRGELSRERKKLRENFGIGDTHYTPLDRMLDMLNGVVTPTSGGKRVGGLISYFKPAIDDDQRELPLGGEDDEAAPAREETPDDESAAPVTNFAEDERVETLLWVGARDEIANISEDDLTKYGPAGPWEVVTHAQENNTDLVEFRTVALDGASTHAFALEGDGLAMGTLAQRVVAVLNRRAETHTHEAQNGEGDVVSPDHEDDPIWQQADAAYERAKTRYAKPQSSESTSENGDAASAPPVKQSSKQRAETKAKPKGGDSSMGGSTKKGSKKGGTKKK